MLKQFFNLDSEFFIDYSDYFGSVMKNCESIFEKDLHTSIATYNTCAKFQRKIVSPNLVGAPGSLRVSNKRYRFFAKSKPLSKITYHYFSVQNQYNKTIRNFVLKSNFQDIHT